MYDDFLSPVWADRHHAIGTFVDDLIDQTRRAFERAAERTYDAPWKHDDAADASDRRGTECNAPSA